MIYHHAKLKLLSLLVIPVFAACVGQQFTSQCWNDAIYAYGSALASGYEARIYIQETPDSGKGIYHAQAVAFIDGEEKWLNVYG